MNVGVEFGDIDTNGAFPGVPLFSLSLFFFSNSWGRVSHTRPFNRTKPYNELLHIKYIFSMIHSLYVVYKTCRYSRLNGSLSLVCKSPDLSKPEEENEWEEEREEEEGESNKGMGSGWAQPENENNIRLWKKGE